MRIELNRVTAFFVVLLLAGCATPSSTTVVIHAAPSARTHELAQLYIINVSGPTLFESNQNITDNGEMIASLPRGMYKRLYITEGKHEFRFAAFPGGNRVAMLEAVRGNTYYLAAGYSPSRSWTFPFAGDPMTIKLITESDAVDLLKEMRPQ